MPFSFKTIEYVNKAGQMEETNSLRVLKDRYGDMEAVRGMLKDGILVVVPDAWGQLVYRDTQQFLSCDCCNRNLALLPDPEAFTTEGGELQCDDCITPWWVRR